MNSFILSTVLGCFYSSVVIAGTFAFFANNNLQRKQPEAFVLQPESHKYLFIMHDKVISAGNKLVEEVKNNDKLYKAILDWKALSQAQEFKFLKEIFEIELQVLGIKPPEFTISSHEIPGRAAFFKFDLDNPDAGHVFLNPEVLKTLPKYASLALLLHETYHSMQFQMAFLNSPIDKRDGLSIIYQSSFKAQKSLDIRSFIDFLTLANEYDAFQFSNYVIGKLMDWKVNLESMGTYGSQFDSNGSLKIDIINLFDDLGSKNLLESFNELEKKQCFKLGYCNEVGKEI